MGFYKILKEGEDYPEPEHPKPQRQVRNQNDTNQKQRGAGPDTNREGHECDSSEDDEKKEALSRGFKRKVANQFGQDFAEQMALYLSR